LTNIREVEPITFIGLKGSLVANHMGNFQGITDVYYSVETKANILSYAELSENPDIEITSAAKMFVVTHKASDHIFRLDNGSYVKEYSDAKDPDVLDEQVVALWMTATAKETKLPHIPRVETVAAVTVKELEEQHPQTDVKQAKAALEFIRKLGVPAKISVIKMIMHNGQGKLNFQPKHIDMADAIYGKRIAVLAGKSTEPANVQMTSKSIHIVPKDPQSIFADVMFVDRETYLLSVVKPIGLVLTTYLPNTGPKAVYIAFSQHVAILTGNGFYTQVIYTDGDKTFGAIKHKLNRLRVKLAVCPNNHVSVAERAIRTVKSWCRGIVADVSSKYRLPKFLLKYVVDFVTQRLNCMSSKRGYPNVPAVEALTGGKVDIDKDFRHCFGDYAECVTPNLGMNKNNVLKSRTESAIALCNADHKGSVKFFSLVSHRLITRRKFDILPLTQRVIDHMNSLPTRSVAPIVVDEGDDEDQELEEMITIPQQLTPQVMPDWQQLEDDTTFTMNAGSSDSVPPDLDTTEKSSDAAWTSDTNSLRRTSIGTLLSDSDVSSHASASSSVSVPPVLNTTETSRGVIPDSTKENVPKVTGKQQLKDGHISLEQSRSCASGAGFPATGVTEMENDVDMYVSARSPSFHDLNHKCATRTKDGPKINDRNSKATVSKQGRPSRTRVAAGYELRRSPKRNSAYVQCASSQQVVTTSDGHSVPNNSSQAKLHADSNINKSAERLDNNAGYNTSTVLRIATAWHISTVKAYPLETAIAVREELQQMIDKKVFSPVHWHGMSVERKKKVIHSFMFSKVKYDSQGTPIKISC
jgi:antitoxin component of RelBE/YafQ-DinJ toxin-antitoxin module